MSRISVMLLCLTFLNSDHQINLYAAYQGGSETLNEKIHRAQPWKVHDITRDFKLLDVWEFPILADITKDQGFSTFLKVLRQPHKISLNNVFSLRNLIAGSLISLRWYLGEIFGLDKKINSLPIPGCTETSVKERLSPGDQKRSLAELGEESEENPSGWRTVYRYDHEMLVELSNNTAHALMHLGWVHKYGNYFTAQLAVYVKPRGNLGALYMKLIMPFRRLIIYPTLLEEVKSRWEDYTEVNQE